MVVNLSLTAEDVAHVIDEEVRFFTGLGREFEWKLYSWDPPELRPSLEARGFAIGVEEVIVMYDLSQDLPEPARHLVQRIATPNEVKAYAELEELVFSESRSAMLLKAIEEGDSLTRGYLSYCDGVPVGFGRLQLDADSGIAGCYGGGTHPDFRGQGVYKSLVAERAREARDAGAEYLLVDALPTSRPILERLGFIPIGSTWPCVWNPGLASAFE